LLSSLSSNLSLVKKNQHFLPGAGKSRLWGIIFFVFEFGKPKKAELECPLTWST